LSLDLTPGYNHANNAFLQRKLRPAQLQRLSGLRLRDFSYIESGTIRAETGRDFGIERSATVVTTGPTDRFADGWIQSFACALEGRCLQRMVFGSACGGRGERAIRRVHDADSGKARTSVIRSGMTGAECSQKASRSLDGLHWRGEWAADLFIYLRRNIAPLWARGSIPTRRIDPSIAVIITIKDPGLLRNKHK